MLNVETRHAIHADHAKSMDTTALRKNFVAGNLFVEGDINLVYTHYERMVVGGVVPGTAKLTLDHVPQTGTPNFLERRELGVVNIGETGTVSADGDQPGLDGGTGPTVGPGSSQPWQQSLSGQPGPPTIVVTLPGEDAGCGCRATPQSHSPWGGGLMAGLFGLWMFNLRRRVRHQTL